MDCRLPYLPRGLSDQCRILSLKTLAPQSWQPDLSALSDLPFDIHLLASSSLRNSKTFALYNSYFRQKQIPALYLPYELASSDLAGFRDLLDWFRRTDNAASLLVSDPFKQLAFESATPVERQPSSTRCEGANLFVKRSGAIEAHSGDGRAFILGEGTQIPGIWSAVFFGCGGVSTSVLLALAEQLTEVLLVEVADARCASLARKVRCFFPSIKLQTRIRPERVDTTPYDMLYNGTGLGKLGHVLGVDATPLGDRDEIASTGIAFDANYTPSETRFLEQCRMSGLTTRNGRAHMLGSFCLHMQLSYGVEVPLRVAEEYFPTES